MRQNSCMTSGLVVRRAGAADVAELAEVAGATFALACPPGTRQGDIDEFVAEHLSAQSFARYVADERRILLLAEHNADAIGYTMLVLDEPADEDVAAAITLRPTAELSKCYVLPQHHGGGAATALIECNIEAAAAHGATGLWLGVNQQNARANRFYEKCGFRVVGTKTFRVGAELHDDFVRERSTD
jgi:GNAT superfamily N-acetyltransferase